MKQRWHDPDSKPDGMCICFGSFTDVDDTAVCSVYEVFLENKRQMDFRDDLCHGIS